MRLNRFFIKYALSFLALLMVQTYYAQKKFVVVLDAGHGGSDIGANRYYEGLGRLNEKDVTLAVTLLVGKKLEKNKEFKVIYTRKTDIYPTLTERTNLANRSKADLFVSMHCNSQAKGGTAYGTETFVQGPNQNKENLEVAKAENDVIYLDAQDRETFASYDPNSPESLIALKIQQSKYLEGSLLLGSFIEENFVKDKRFSRGVKQQNLHVLRRNAMPSVLVEMGFISNYDDAAYLASSRGQEEIAESIYKAILSYRQRMDRNMVRVIKEEPKKEEEQPSKNDFRVLLMSSSTKYNEGDPAFKGLKYILTIKEGSLYRYYYSVTNYNSVKQQNLKTAKDAGFRSAVVKNFVPNEKLSYGHYTLEVAVSSSRLAKSDPIMVLLSGVEREKIGGLHYYTYGNVKTLEEAVELKKKIEAKGIKNIVIQKK